MGAAICAAVASGVYADFATAQKAMASSFDATYFPKTELVEVYEKLYLRYLKLGEFVEK